MEFEVSFPEIDITYIHSLKKDIALYNFHEIY